MAQLVPALCGYLPTIPSYFNCTAITASLLPYARDPYLEPTPSKFVAARACLNDLKGPTDLQDRIDYIQMKLQERQAEIPGKCLRGFVDYLVHKSIPLKLCQAAQKLDLAWIRASMTYLGNKLLKTSSTTPMLEGRQMLEQVEKCQAEVESISGEEYLFERVHQTTPPLTNGTQVIPDNIFLVTVTIE